MKRKVLIIGNQSIISSDLIEKLIKEGADDIAVIDSLSALEEKPRPHVPDMEEIMLEVTTKESNRKANLRKMGRDQFKKKNRRKI